jgi:hypothetical protein
MSLKTVTVRLPEDMKSKLESLPGTVTSNVVKAINGLSDLASVTSSGAGSFSGEKVVTSYRIGPAQLRILDDAAKHLGSTRSAVLLLAIGNFLQFAI